MTEHVEQWISRHRGLGGAFHIGGVTGAVAIGGLAVAAAGTGFSIYSSMQQGEAAASNASANAGIISKNAELQYKSDQMQIAAEVNDATLSKKNAQLSYRMGQIDEANANLSGVQAEMNAAVSAKNYIGSAADYRLDASLSISNAHTLNNYARGVEAQGKEQITRFREEGRELMAVAGNRLAKSGIAAEGSPLQVMARNAALIELKVQDMHYETELSARSIDRAAYNERFKAKRSLMAAKTQVYNANQSLRSGRLAKVGTAFSIAGAKLEQEGAKYAEDAADFRIGQGQDAYDLAWEKYQNTLETAGVTAASGAATQRAATYAAIGTGLAGAADAFQTGDNYFGWSDSVKKKKK